jgi:predicted GIY-YIG superfamily endonuclease
MAKHTLPDLQSVVDKIATLYYRIEKLVELINLDSLPSVNVDNERIFEALPHDASCVYFLTHAEHGLLYIGKALDFKNRIKYHGHLQPAIELGNVKLSWLELPRELLAICEDILISQRSARWNRRLSWTSKRSNFEYMKKYSPFRGITD